LLSIAIWLAAIGLETVPLLRGVRTRSIRHFAVFYSYLFIVLMSDLINLTVYFRWPREYPYVYWSSEHFAVLIGCALVWEVYRIAFARYPGAARISRDVLLFLFIVAAARIAVKAWNNAKWIPERSTLETDLDLRVIQVVLLLALVALFAYYAIPLGRNLKAIIYGYGFFLVTNVTGLTLRYQLGDSFQRAWQYFQQSSYFVVLLVWCWGLWRYRPVPQPEREPALEADYERLIRETKSRLQLARSRLLRGMRP
jgi:hypothetical protein